MAIESCHRNYSCNHSLDHADIGALGTELDVTWSNIALFHSIISHQGTLLREGHMS